LEDEPRNYFVPDLGRDRDILDVEESIGQAVKYGKKFLDIEDPWVISKA
jgi:hypothetical protein